jgi:peptidoglycan/LPS O-acetylase OafA/YrhL
VGFVSFQDQGWPSKRFPQLDGVRGIAIILVLLFHYGPPALFPTTAPGTAGAYALKLITLSWSGVDLFFVLSGFLIGGILLDHAHEQNAFRVFYARRFFRIVPLYLLVLIIGLAFRPSRLAPIASYLTFTQNMWMVVHDDWRIFYSVTWSLAVEEQFYLFLPFLIWLAPRRWLPAILVSLIVAAPLFRLLAFNFNSRAPHLLFPCRMDALLIGVLLAYVMRQERARTWLYQNQTTLYIVFALSLVWPTIATHKGWSVGAFPMETFGLTLLAFTYACFLLIAAVETRGPIAWVTNLAPLRRFGVLAYCIYLIHVGLFGFLFDSLGRDFSTSALLGVCLIASVGIAEASWRFFEGPLISLGHRWIYSGQMVSSPNSVTSLAST